MMSDTLPEIECVGDARAMGRQQGRALQANIRRAMLEIGKLEAFHLMKPRWMPMRLFRQLAERKAHRFMKNAFDSGSGGGEFEQRFVGICEGAGLSQPNLALCCLLEAVMSDLTGSSREQPNGLQAGCSAIAVTGPASKTGDARVMHNFDHVPVVQQFFVVRRSNPTGKLKSVEFTFSPLLGAVDGVNEAGLGVTCNYAYVTDRLSAAPTITMLIARVLAEATTVTEAIELIAGQPRAGGGLLMLADAAGDITSLEVSNSRVQPRAAEDGFVFHTNRLQCGSMVGLEIGADAQYDHRAPTLLRGRRVHESADLRAESIQAAVTGRLPLSLDDMQQIMSGHAHGDSCNSVCMHGDYWSTTACTQVLPKERKLRVAFDNPCQAKLQEFAV
ncbi:MAG: C45 family peptidase [Rubripirellula sp.]|nr:C45 family peptidase [Rubripirellula sp.]